MILAIYILLNLLSGTHGFSSGAPSKMCESMIPKHEGSLAQSRPPPYEIKHVLISPHKYNVTVSSPAGSVFKGLILQARSKANSLPALGTYSDISPSLQIRSCPDDQGLFITHSDNNNKNLVHVIWDTPTEFEGTVTFFATVVESFNTFWTNITSNPISVSKRSAEPGQQEQLLPSFVKNIYSGCGTVKKCLGSPPDCIKSKNCSTIVSVKPVNNKYQFEMYAKESKYVAGALSEDDIMGGDGDSVLECVVSNSSEVVAYRSWNLPLKKQNQRLDAIDQKGYQLMSSKYMDGNVYCKVEHDPIVEIGERKFFLSEKEYYLLLASGSKLKDNGVGFHDKTFVRSVSKSLLSDFKPYQPPNNFYDGCNVLKNCFGVPDGCIDSQSCQLVVSILARGTKYDFALMGKSDGYIAVGLSDDSKMGGDSVVECVIDKNMPSSVQAYQSWNIENAKSNTRTSVSQDGLQLLNSSFIDGNIFCHFTRDEKTFIRGQQFDLSNKEYYILLASGSQTQENGVRYHDIIFTLSGEKQYLSDVKSFVAMSKLLLRLHGTFMIVAWIGCASLGILFARYYKQTWVGKSVCGKDIWFNGHRTLMLLAWSLTICGFILIFIEIGEWVQGGSQLHAILGCVTTFFAFIQPIGAAFRPAPNALNRPIFNWFHWFFGNTAYIFAIATIFFAVPLSKAELPQWFNWMIVPHVVLYIVAHIVLSVNQCVSQRDTNKIEPLAMKDFDHGNSPTLNSSDRQLDAPNSRSRKFVLTLFVIGNTIIVIGIAIVVLLAPVEGMLQNIQDKIY